MGFSPHTSLAPEEIGGPDPEQGKKAGDSEPPGSTPVSEHIAYCLT